MFVHNLLCYRKKKVKIRRQDTSGREILSKLRCLKKKYYEEIER
jgi:hypothetical protein